MPASVPTALPAFELHDLRHRDGELVVTGSWSGVRGMRFMRPTLTVAGRRALATMEHKPWAPDGEEPWTAAFPWEDGPPDPRDASLAVAPSVTVRLAGAWAEAAPGPDPIVAERRRFERREAEVGVLRDELRAAREERDRAMARIVGAEAERAAAAAAAEQAERRLEHAVRQRDGARQERDAARAALERERRARAASAATREQEDPTGARTSLTEYDLLAFRVVGVIAAISFVALLASLLRAIA